MERPLLVKKSEAGVLPMKYMKGVGGGPAGEGEEAAAGAAGIVVLSSNNWGLTSCVPPTDELTC
jgi:hypothetical protein